MVLDVLPASIAPPRSGMASKSTRLSDEPDSGQPSFEKVMRDKEKEQGESEGIRAAQGAVAQSQRHPVEADRKAEPVAKDAADRPGAEKVTGRRAEADEPDAQSNHPSSAAQTGGEPIQAFAAVLPPAQPVTDPTTSASDAAQNVQTVQAAQGAQTTPAMQPAPAAQMAQTVQAAQAPAAQTAETPAVPAQQAPAPVETGTEALANAQSQAIPSVPIEAQPVESSDPAEGVVQVPVAEDPSGKNAPASVQPNAFSQAIESIPQPDTTPAAPATPAAAPAAQAHAAKGAEAAPALKAKVAQDEVEVNSPTSAETGKSATPLGAQPVQVKAAAELQTTVRETSGKAATLAADMTQQIARNVEASMQQGKNYLRMQLNPQDLGAIDIRLHNTANGVHVTVIAEQASTGRMLETHLNQLRQTLADAGVQLGNLNINQHAQGQQQGRGFEQNSYPRSLDHQRLREQVEVLGEGTSTLPVTNTARGVDCRI